MHDCKDVSTSLTYLASDSARPTYLSDEPGGEERPTGLYVDVPVAIRDARSLPQSPRLDVEGFCLVRHGTRDVDFSSDHEVATNYYPQVAALLKRCLAANEAVVFDHNVRVDAPRDGIRRPARHVHVDYTFRSAIRRMIELSGEESAVERLRRPFVQVNFWRPIMYPAETSPLALADGRTVPPTDYVTAEIIYPGWRGEILEVKHGASHQWFYFPGMTPEEGVVFKGFDSRTGTASCRTPHSAFHDPTTRRDAPPRMSIELRALVFL